MNATTSNIADRLYAQARIVPVQADRRVKSVKKLGNGDLEVTQHGGAVFTLDAADELFQSFLIWSVLNVEA